jgi:hypothetical protein
MALQDIATLLSFIGTRAGALVAATIPALVTPAGHPNAVRKTAVKRKGGKPQDCDCFPWNGGGAKVDDACIVKRANVRVLLGVEWDAFMTGERLRQGNPAGLNPDGTAIPYVGGPIMNGTVWVHDAAGMRLAFKTNPSESRLYVPCVIVASEGYTYHDAGGNVIPASVVNPFLRPVDDAREAARQGVDVPLRWRDYAADNVSDLRVGTALAEGDAKRLADALAAGDHATVRELAAAFAPSVTATATA